MSQYSPAPQVECTSAIVISITIEHLSPAAPGRTHFICPHTRPGAHSIVPTHSAPAAWCPTATPRHAANASARCPMLRSLGKVASPATAARSHAASFAGSIVMRPACCKSASVSAQNDRLVASACSSRP
jgi:hypothetical protein